MNQTPSLLTVAKVITIAAGMVIVMAGFIGSAFILLTGGATLDSAVTGTALFVLNLGLGSALIWHSSQSILNRASSPFRLPAIGWLLLLYVPVLAAGQLIISYDIFPTLTFPPFHILAAVLPPLAILAFAGRAFKSTIVRWREVILHLASGAFLSVTLALVVEIIIGMAVIVITFVIMALTSGGSESVEAFIDNLQNPIWLQNPENVQELLQFPPIALSLVLVFVILAPMAEELLKLLGVTLMSYRRPLPAQIFIWGLAGGAGFTLVENLFNTVLALDTWAVIMLLRIGGTAMHCLGTGLMALGWQHWLTHRRPWRLMGAYTISLTIHAWWNGAVIGIAGISVFAIGATDEITLFIVGSVAIVLIIGLIALTIAMLIAIVMITKRLQFGLSDANV